MRSMQMPFSGEKNWPKITLATPVLNHAKYIEQAIRSVIYQGYPNLEYIVVDGGSTDGTVEIIRKYENHLHWWVSEPDYGPHHAIDKAFTKSSGEIMGWIGGTDMLHQGSLFVVGSVFQCFPQVEWITGRRTFYSEDGMAIRVENLARPSYLRYLAGAWQSIQPESTFWRRSLWEKAAGQGDVSSRLVGEDFRLWLRFFRCAHVYPVNALVGGLRLHPDAHHKAAGPKLYSAVNRLLDQELWEAPDIKLRSLIKWFRKLSATFYEIPVLRSLWARSIIRTLYYLNGPDLPSIIEYRNGRWVMR